MRRGPVDDKIVGVVNADSLLEAQRHGECRRIVDRRLDADFAAGGTDNPIVGFVLSCNGVEGLVEPQDDRRGHHVIAVTQHRNNRRPVDAHGRDGCDGCGTGYRRIDDLRLARSNRWGQTRCRQCKTRPRVCSGVRSETIKAARATPSTSDTDTGGCACPSIVNVTLPEGEPGPLVGATVTVKVTLWPVIDGLAEARAASS